MTDAIEAGARAIDAHWSEGDDRKYPFEDTEGSYRAHCRSTAKACIEAAIASGALVPASAVAEMKERCVAIIESYAQPDRFKPSDQWKEDMTVADVYETGVIDAMGWAAQEVRQLDLSPASGDYVVVPREPTEAMIWAGHHEIDWCRNGQATHIPDHPSQIDDGVGTTCKQDICDAWIAMLNAASSNGGGE